MTKLSDLHKEWMSDPEFRSEYEALHLEFELIRALIGARTASKMTQEEVAERMGTTQSAVARLEGGRSNPSVKTLEKYAKATGTQLRIGFEPVEVDTPQSGNGTVADVAIPAPATRGSEVAEQSPVVT